MEIQVLYFILVVIALFQIFLSIREYKHSKVGNLFWHFLTVTILLSGINVFIYLVDLGAIKVEEATFMVIWHLIFYLAIGVFILVAHSLVNMADIDRKSPPNPLFVGIGSITMMAVLFACAKPVEPWIETYITGSWWDMIGGFHFLAFLFAGWVSGYLYLIKIKFSTTIGSIAFPLLCSVGTLSLIHAWELLTESWKLIYVGHETIELVEKMLWIPVYLFIIYAFWRLRKSITKKIV